MSKQNVFEKTSDLLREIVLSAFPHEEKPSGAGWDWKASDETSAFQHVITTSKAVEVGDVVAIVDNYKRRGEWGYNPVPADRTLRDVAADWNNFHLYVVTRKTEKRLSLRPLRMPDWFNSSDVPFVDYESEWEEQTYAPYADARRIVRTGLTVDELLRHVEEHPKHAQFVTTLAKAREVKQADERAWQRKHEAEKAIEKAAETEAKRLSTIVGIKGSVVRTWVKDEVRLDKSNATVKALVKEILRLRLEAGQITQEEYDAVERVPVRS